MAEEEEEAACGGGGAHPAGASPAEDSGSATRYKVSLGICCMASKASSPPMQAILRRLEICGDFKIVIFPEEVIVSEPAQDWPVVDCLIAFASTGFPQDKCLEYCRLRNPRCINRVEAQSVFRSRTGVYRTLTDWCIPCPEHIIVNHMEIQPNSPDFIEHENYVMFRGKKINKPFVEKPDDGDRHDIWIYYPRSIGGGAKKLFRKVKDKSSEFDPNQNNIRRDGTYVYEPFLPTQGTDIKVYTVGAGYVHAEARKAPTVDGKVQRSKDGKEVRYPVVLTQGEKAIAAFIVKAFRQKICGFDILRTDGGSYVCDVNGWSFVKGNQKYYNDCATLIRKHFLDECGISGVDTSTAMILGPGDEKVSDTAEEPSHDDYSTRDCRINKSSERLRSVIVVLRHGDRRPKEKMKFKCKQPGILAYFDSVDEGTAEVKLKTPEEMATLRCAMDAARQGLRDQLAEIDAMAPVPDGPGQEAAKAKQAEKRADLQQELASMEPLIPVLEMKDRFSGLERKVQLKATKWEAQKENQPRRATQVLVVAKWGGELTVSGLSQSQELGRRLRHDLYPNDPTGLLRLHSSFRHDFKIYSSQEGRCQITAAAFTKGFLDLEGDIIPILVSLVTRDKFAQDLLDEPIPKKLRGVVKQKIESLLMSYSSIGSPQALPDSCPTGHSGLREAARRIGSPLQLLHTLRYMTTEYIDSITAAKDRTYEEMRGAGGDDNGTPTNHDDEDAHEDAVPLGDKVPLGIPYDLQECCKRRWLHLRRKEHRWRKLVSSFVRLKDEAAGPIDANITYDPSKIPDVWDNLYYDMLTHRHYLGEESCKVAEMMVGILHPLSEWVCLSEYGISQDEKLRIGVDVTWRLLGKMLNDLEFMIDADRGRPDGAGRSTSLQFSDQAAVGVARCYSGVASHSSLGAEGGVPRCLSGDVRSSHGGYPAAGRGTDEPSATGPADGEASSGPGSPTAADEQQAAEADRLSEGPSFMMTEELGGPAGAPWRELAAPPPEHSAGGGAPECAAPGSDQASRTPSLAPPLAPSPASPLPADLTGSQAAEDAAQHKTPEDGGSGNGGGSARGSLASKKGSARSKLSRLTPEVRNELKQALRDGSDWHPTLAHQVAGLTDLNYTRIVRSRVYVTSASTMHSLVNILRHAKAAGIEAQVLSDLDKVTDLNYLSHIVFRCYEQGDQDSSKAAAAADAASEGLDPSCPAERQTNVENEKARYRVEISMSPGVQVFEDGRHLAWPKGSDMTSRNCQVAPLQIVASSMELRAVERFIADTVKEFGREHEEEETADEKHSDND